MEHLIITGANGLIGSACCNLLQDKYFFDKFDISDHTNPVDITNEESVLQAVQKSSAQYMIHLAAFTDVTAAWQQNGDTTGAAYKVNVLGTQNLVKACNEFNKHIIHVSTSYVFDGNKIGQYTENDQPHPIEWYGETKLLAEQFIQEHAQNWTIFRIDQPFKPEPFAKLDLAHKIATDLKAGSLYPQFEDHYFGPTWIPDFVKTIEWSIRNSKHGLYHASSGETWNNFEFAQKVAEAIGSNTQVQASKLEEYLKTNNRPYQKNTALNCEKLLREIDFQFTPIATALVQVNY